MSAHTFDVDLFRLQFPAFTDAQKYPDVLLSGFFNIACQYIDANDNFILCGAQLQLALNYLTAHLMQGSVNIAAGTMTTGIVTSATVGNVTVGMQAPPIANAWQQWLSGTPYGLQLWALLEISIAGGFGVGGLPEGSSFRKVGGVW